MKQFIQYFGIALLPFACTSCFQSEEPMGENIQSDSKLTTFQFETFGLSQGSLSDQTRANFTANPTTMLVIDVKDGEVKQTLQLTENTVTDGSGFQHVDDVLSQCSMVLSYGQHDLYFLAAAREYAQVDTEALTVSWSTDVKSLSYTWAKKVNVSISQSSESTQSVSLPLIAGRVDLICLDEQDPSISKMQISGSDICWTLDLTTMKGRSSADGISLTIPYTQDNYNANKSFTFFSFEPEGTWGGGTPNIGSVTYGAYRADNTLITSHTLANVPVRTGYYTQYQGIFYGSSSNFSMSVDDSFAGVFSETF